LSRSGSGEHAVALGEVVGANDCAPLHARLLEISSEFGRLTLRRKLDDASVRNRAHMPVMVAFRTVGSKTGQPIIVIHQYRGTLNRKRAAEEKDEQAAIFQEVDQLERAGLQFGLDSLKNVVA